jgi:hypothetical protein
MGTRIEADSMLRLSPLPSTVTEVTIRRDEVDNANAEIREAIRMAAVPGCMRIWS